MCRRARDQPVDPRADLLGRQDLLLDEQVLERLDAGDDGRLAVGRDRLVRMVVLVAVAHASSASQCSNRSTSRQSSSAPS